MYRHMETYTYKLLNFFIGYVQGFSGVALNSVEVTLVNHVLDSLSPKKGAEVVNRLVGTYGWRESALPFWQECSFSSAILSF
uniref:Uncharacterized protein n=1 Tax=Anguilla anguilla TaxID=7936 RepID=A0A0E9XKQ9_ANGAN